MADLKKIREEILNDILEKRKNLPENILKRINLELDFLESTDGLNNKSNLETLYNIYKKRNGQVGHKNNINSMVCYALGLTDKKPEGELLPLRRAFARASFPDVDTDFADIKQDDIFNYLISKYGRENGSRVGTHQFLNFKSCVTRVAKALDVADSFHKGKDDYITDNAKKVKDILLPFPKKGLMKVKDENGESHIIKNIKDAYDFCQDFRYYMDKYPLLNKYSREIEGTFSGFGRHASGFVLSDTSISDIAPMRKAKGGKIATQFVGTELETLGLIKFDILGLATLSVIELALKYIKENYDIDIDIHNLKVDDQKTFKLYQSGRLAGVFQCEQPGMQQTMRDIHVDKFEDIMAGIALYRPGPMDSIPEYCARKKGEKPISYFHKSIEPFVKPYLEKTYGLIVYQESIMQICNSLAGFTISDGYVIIKAIGKKKKDLMFKFENQFINGCAKNNVPKDVAKQYWDKVIVPFADYAFNISHSASYGFNSYLTAYLKANYPEEFVCAVLEVETIKSNGDKYEKIALLEKEFEKYLPLKFLKRDINHSKVSYIIEKKKDPSQNVHTSEIRPSLLCKGMGLNAAIEIEKHQPYNSLKELAIKTSFSVVDARCIDALIESGYINIKKKKKEEVIKEFLAIREDLKKAANKGIESVDIFE